MRAIWSPSACGLSRLRWYIASVMLSRGENRRNVPGHSRRNKKSQSRRVFENRMFASTKATELAHDHAIHSRGFKGLVAPATVRWLLVVPRHVWP